MFLSYLQSISRRERKVPVTSKSIFKLAQKHVNDSLIVSCIQIDKTRNNSLVSLDAQLNMKVLY